MTAGTPNRGRRTRRPDVDAEFEQGVAKRLRNLAIDREARHRLASQLAGETFVFPKPGRTLADDLAHPPRDRKFIVDELHLAGGDTLLVAQYKTGKTTLVMNLAMSLADGEPFLGKFAVAPLDGRIAFWNYELDADLFREWARDLDIKHPERIAEPLHLRGVSLPFWLPEYGERAVDWLRVNEIEFLIIDPAARAWSGLVTAEIDNTQVGAFTDALDALKREAAVPNLVLTTHTGRQQFEEGNERSRGATRLEDWMDAGWYLTKDDEGRRALRASGRDVAVEALDLHYSAADRRLTTTGQTRTQRRELDGMRRVAETLAEEEAITTAELERRIEGEKAARSAWVRAAARNGYVERRYPDGTTRDEGDPARKGIAQRCYLTDRGRKLAEGRISLAHDEEGPVDQ